MIDSDLLTGASLDELKQGYRESADSFTCICCGQRVEKGVVYPVDDRLYEAQRYIRHHIAAAHGSVFAHLVGLDKSAHGLSDLQRRLLTLLYDGRSDDEIKKALGAGSLSTIRNHRFILREKERQARLFLAIMELLNERLTGDETTGGRTRSRAGRAASGEAQGAGGRAGSGEGAGDGRAVRGRPRGAASDQAILARYFPHGLEGPLQHFGGSTPMKHKRIIAAAVAGRFAPGRRYSEREVNEILEPIAEDYVLLRRLLVDFGYLSRLPDGSQYWRGETDQERVSPVDRRKELKRLAREAKTEGGVFQVRNSKNGMVWIGVTPNFRSLNGHRFQLEMGSHKCRELQQAWNEFGPDAFVFEPLETLEEPETGYFDRDDALKKLKRKWLEKLQPFGDRGYNLPSELDEGNR
ncbi:DUF2087 domain-containing protein [Symbiobacterium terraclitae]|uniref:DUF2087 domain-containing protein n=1 Tax=Symbiobacterium terraclitae TaxID=557451 RepID=UPI0035B564E9